MDAHDLNALLRTALTAVRAAIVDLLGQTATVGVLVARTVVTEAENGGYSISAPLTFGNPLRYGPAWTDLNDRGWTWRGFGLETVASALHRSYGEACVFDPGWSAPNDPDFASDPELWIERFICEPMAKAYIAGLEHLRDDDEALITRLGTELTNFIVSEGTPHTVQLALNGLTFPDGITRYEGYEVRPLSLVEIGSIIHIPRRDQSISTVALPDTVWSFQAWPDALVSITYDGHDNRTEGGQKASGSMQRFLTALSILGVRITAPQARGEIRVSPPWLTDTKRGTRPFAIMTSDFNPPRDSIVTQAIVERAVKFSKKIPANAWLQPKSYRDVVYHRYMQGMARQQDIDRVFDFVVAMESCLVHDNQELGHKSGLFGAQFLGTSGSDRLEIRDQLKSLYSLRSRLAHGTKFPTQDEIRTGARSAQNLCQRMLVKCLDGEWPVDGDLDNLLLSRDDT